VFTLDEISRRRKRENQLADGHLMEYQNLHPDVSFAKFRLTLCSFNAQKKDNQVPMNTTKERRFKDHQSQQTKNR